MRTLREMTVKHVASEDNFMQARYIELLADILMDGSKNGVEGFKTQCEGIGRALNPKSNGTRLIRMIAGTVISKQEVI